VSYLNVISLSSFFLTAHLAGNRVVHDGGNLAI
jgi:hypothetical protein